MGIIGKVIGAGASLIGAGAEAIGKGIENAFLKQEQKNLEYLSKFPYKYKFIVREVKERMDDMEFAKKMNLKEDFFAVYNEKNEPIYVAGCMEKSKKPVYVFKNMDDEALARILLSGSVLNAKKKNCVIEFGNETYEIGTNYSFDKRKFSINNDGYRMDCNDTGKEIRVYGKKNKKIMQINKISSDLGMKWGEYVIGCNEQEHEMMTVLFGVAVGIMLIESSNLLE